MNKISGDTLENLTIKTNVHMYNRWLPEDELDRVFEHWYCRSTHTIYLVIGRAPLSDYNTKTITLFRERYPHAVLDSAPKIIEALYSKARKNKANQQKQREYKKFVSDTTGGIKIDDVLTTFRFLDGAIEGGGGGGVKIEGDLLSYYGVRLLYRLKHDEFLMGAPLSGSGSNQPSCASRIMSTLLSSSVTLWPSTLNWRTNIEAGVHDLVFSWCRNRLRLAHVKYPNTRKFSRAYELIHQQAMEIYIKGMKRWPGEIDPDLDEEIQECAKVFGDRKAMKRLISGWRMQHKMEGL